MSYGSKIVDVKYWTGGRFVLNREERSKYLQCKKDNSQKTLKNKYDAEISSKRK